MERGALLLLALARQKPIKQRTFMPDKDAKEKNSEGVYKSKTKA